MNKRYSLVFHGEIALDQDPKVVRHKVRTLLKTDSSGVEKIFSGQKIYIKKGLDSATATRYKQAFEATGAFCSLEPEAPVKSAYSKMAHDKKIRCPRCGVEQQEALTCINCGIVFAKYRQRQEAQRHGIPEGYAVTDGAPGQSIQTVSGTTRGAGLARVFRYAVIIAVIAVCGYFGYRKFAGGTAGNVVFTSNDCGDPCQSAVAHLTMAGVEFTECNIDSSKENLKKFRKYGGNTLPLAIISDKPLFGYNQATYQNVIDEFQGKYLQESANSVVMYSSRGCGYCRRAQELFAEYRIQYVEHDISYPDSRQRYTELNGRGVPLILINGTRINGFDKQAILEALQKAGLM